MREYVGNSDSVEGAIDSLIEMKTQCDEIYSRSAQWLDRQVITGIADFRGKCERLVRLCDKNKATSSNPTDPTALAIYAADAIESGVELWKMLKVYATKVITEEEFSVITSDKLQELIEAGSKRSQNG
jgi:hypothetical protein